jgi:hypothetical protein
MPIFASKSATMMATQERTFATCTLKYLDKAFGTRQVSSLPSLDQWMAVPSEITDLDKQFLLRLQTILDFNVHDWNEYELDTHFIGPIFSLVNFSTYEFNHFGQRDLSAVVDDTLLYGRVDGMIASGRREPELPYFAFQEYKRNLDPNGDPAGQCLAAMLAGQALGLEAAPTNTYPTYGCYVAGRDWYFMALEGRSYASTKGHNALDTAELFDIFRILKALRQLVVERTSA